MTHSSKSSLNLSNLSVRSLPSPSLTKRYRYSVMPTNDELNNKIDLEIRILDGILKLLNAISLKQQHQANSTNLNEQNLIQIDSNLVQILTACKCLFVSHRKLAIYMNSPLAIQFHERNQQQKLYLDNIRIPLAWKWTDYMRAQKNSENISSKFVTFALIYVGNCIYDTDLLTNVDATMTEISFKEKFVFDDVNIQDFELKFEIYSYEIQNTSSSNLIIHSARKLAKQLYDFAKKSNHTISGPSMQFINQNDSSYAYSSHRFKLCAKASLTQKDLNDHIEARNMILINDTNLENQMGLGLGQSSLTLNNINMNTATNGVNNNSNNRLPLFDHFCCKLTTSNCNSYLDSLF